MFTVALTVLAIFPMALGLGTGRIKAAASAAAALQQLESNHDDDTAQPVETVEDRRLGDAT